jgi:hypothetical protein
MIRWGTHQLLTHPLRPAFRAQHSAVARARVAGKQNAVLSSLGTIMTHVHHRTARGSSFACFGLPHVDAQRTRDQAPPADLAGHENRALPWRTTQRTQVARIHGHFRHGSTSPMRSSTSCAECFRARTARPHTKQSCRSESHRPCAKRD